MCVVSQQELHYVNRLYCTWKPQNKNENNIELNIRKQNKGAFLKTEHNIS